VRVSPDLAHARVYLSFFKTEKPKEMLAYILSIKKEIRHKFGDAVRNQLRIVPDFDFYIDDSIDYFENIERLLKTD
jgi:ribosome-binding factor A